VTSWVVLVFLDNRKIHEVIRTTTNLVTAANRLLRQGCRWRITEAVLVGHSYGGAVITEAGNHPKVAALVYIAAFAPDTGESCATIEQALPPASKGIKPTDDGYFYIDPVVFHADFAADLPEAKAAFMAESQVLISADSFTTPVTTPAWKSKPSWCMVATADRSINPDQERMMAKRANAKTIEVNSSHVAYISHPKETAKLIEEAATSATVDQTRSAEA
jgi:pimeloyl-ACP methyl ester carboxylesterase